MTHIGLSLRHDGTVERVSEQARALAIIYDEWEDTKRGFFHEAVTKFMRDHPGSRIQVICPPRQFPEKQWFPDQETVAILEQKHGLSPEQLGRLHKALSGQIGQVPQ